MHIAASCLATLAGTGSSPAASTGPSLWDIGSAILGAGILGFLTWLIDLFRTRSRFGATALIDDHGTVIAQVVKKGDKKAWVSAMEIVVVKSRIYRWINNALRGTEASPIQIAKLAAPTEALEPNQPFKSRTKLPESLALPPPRNPFGRWTDRAWKHSELRLQVTAGGSKPKYIRCKHKRGKYTDDTDVADATPAPPVPQEARPAAQEPVPSNSDQDTSSNSRTKSDPGANPGDRFT